MPNGASTAEPIFYDTADDLYVRFSRIRGDLAAFMGIQNAKIAETRALVDREPSNSIFAAHWTRKARSEMGDEYMVNYAALKECEQRGLISSEDARACEVGAYYERVESMHARLGMSGPICVTTAQKKKMEELVCDV